MKGRGYWITNPTSTLSFHLDVIKSENSSSSVLTVLESLSYVGAARSSSSIVADAVVVAMVKNYSGFDGEKDKEGVNESMNECCFESRVYDMKYQLDIVAFGIWSFDISQAFSSTINRTRVAAVAVLF